MGKRTEKDFFDWLYGASFQHGTTRYGQFPGHHVFASKYSYDEKLQEILDNMEGGDNEALDAGKKLYELHQKKEIWMQYDDNPAIAMTKLVNEIRNYYFGVLNKD